MKRKLMVFVPLMLSVALLTGLMVYDPQPETENLTVDAVSEADYIEHTAAFIAEDETFFAEADVINEPLPAYEKVVEELNGIDAFFYELGENPENFTDMLPLYNKYLPEFHNPLINNNVYLPQELWRYWYDIEPAMMTYTTINNYLNETWIDVILPDGTPFSYKAPINLYMEETFDCGACFYEFYSPQDHIYYVYEPIHVKGCVSIKDQIFAGFEAEAAQIREQYETAMIEYMYENGLAEYSIVVGNFVVTVNIDLDVNTGQDMSLLNNCTHPNFVIITMHYSKSGPDATRCYIEIGAYNVVCSNNSCRLILNSYTINFVVFHIWGVTDLFTFCTLCKYIQ